MIYLKFQFFLLIHRLMKKMKIIKIMVKVINNFFKVPGPMLDHLNFLHSIVSVLGRHGTVGENGTLFHPLSDSDNISDQMSHLA